MLVSVRSSSSKNGVARVTAEEPLEMQCRVLGARPPPPIDWRIDDSRLTNLEQNITVNTFDIDFFVQLIIFYGSFILFKFSIDVLSFTHLLLTILLQPLALQASTTQTIAVFRV